MEASKIRCRNMRPDDLDSVVIIHQQAFDGFFLTRMGPKFLRAYYQTVLDFPSSIAIVAFNSDTDIPIGFAVGFSDPQRFYALFNQRKRNLLTVVGIALLRNPSLIAQAIRNMLRVEARADEENDAVELSSIAVSGKNRGIGSVLIELFMQLAQERKAKTIILSTDANGNDKTRTFYERHGFELKGTEKRGRRNLCHYARSLG